MPYKKYYWAHREEALADSKRWQREHKEEVKKYRPAEYSKEYMKKYRAREDVKFKNRARDKVREAIRLGRLVRGVCEVTGCAIVGEGHHPDYNEPLAVQWLCKQHHEDVHHKGLIIT